MRALLDMQSVLGFDRNILPNGKILENVGSVLTFEENVNIIFSATEGMLFTGLVLQYMYPAGGSARSPINIS